MPSILNLNIITAGFAASPITACGISPTSTCLWPLLHHKGRYPDTVILSKIIHLPSISLCQCHGAVHKTSGMWSIVANILIFFPGALFLLSFNWGCCIHLKWVWFYRKHIVNLSKKLFTADRSSKSDTGVKEP